jgi:phosphoribosylaminoimidazole-succinocarboxamide synthase
VSEAKDRATTAGVADWKSLCEHSPEPLADEVITAARDLYCAGTNAYVGRPAFEAPALDEAIETIQSL